MFFYAFMKNYADIKQLSFNIAQVTAYLKRYSCFYAKSLDV